MMNGQLPSLAAGPCDRPRPSKAPRLNTQRQAVPQQGLAAVAAVARPSVAPRVNQQQPAVPQEVAPAVAADAGVPSWGECPVQHRRSKRPNRFRLSTHGFPVSKVFVQMSPRSPAEPKHILTGFRMRSQGCPERACGRMSGRAWAEQASQSVRAVRKLGSDCAVLFPDKSVKFHPCLHVLERGWRSFLEEGSGLNFQAAWWMGLYPQLVTDRRLAGICSRK